MTFERDGFLRSVAPAAAAVLLAIVALAVHPHMTGHATLPTELREIRSLSARDRLVHGTLLVLLGILLAAFSNYALHRGIRRLPVIAGLVSFAAGIGSLFAAGLIDGFILPQIVAQIVDASAAAQNAALTTLSACATAVNVSTEFGIIAMAIAIAAWSFDLVRDVGRSRSAGTAGFASAGLSVAVLAMGGPILTPHALLAVLGAQGVWYVWIAALLARERA